MERPRQRPALHEGLAKKKTLAQTSPSEQQWVAGAWHRSSLPAMHRGHRAAAETHPSVGHRCPHCPAPVLPLFICHLMMASVVRASAGALFGLNRQHIFIFGMAKLYIYVCVCIYVYKGFSAAVPTVAGTAHCTALKPCPRWAEMCFSPSIQSTQGTAMWKAMRKQLTK